MSSSGEHLEKIYLDTHCGLEILRDRLEKAKDLSPENKRLYETVTKMSAYFRFQWEEQKATNEVVHWKGASWEMLRDLKKELGPRRRRTIAKQGGHK